jgi:hypothetical protein
VEDVKGLSYDILRKNFEGGNDNPHSARVTFNSNPPSFLERKIFIHYTIPAECRLWLLV